MLRTWSKLVLSCRLHVYHGTSTRLLCSTHSIDPNAHKPLRGIVLAKEINANVSKKVKEFQKLGWQPCLNSITIGNSPATTIYVRNQKKLAEKNGIVFESILLPRDISRTELLARIAAFNIDPKITGIIIQRPVPEHLNINEVQQAVHPLKDVEGMHPTSIGNVVYNDNSLSPCTAKAAVELLKHTPLSLPGLQCVVVGHSEIVGKPVSFLLLSEGCTVTICHHMTRNLATHTRQADALFVAVGKPNLITNDMIKPGAVVIDIGINIIENEQGETKLVGDVDYEPCLQTAGWITPVPGGVGVVTSAILMQNTIVLAARQQAEYVANYGPTHIATNSYMLSGAKNAVPQ